MSEEFIHAVSEHFIPALIASCVLIGMVMKAVTTIVVESARERTRREISAYVAEGSITPEQAELLLVADRRKVC